MLSRVKRFCLLLVRWFFVGLAAIVLIGNAYVMLRMTIGQLFA